MRNAAICLVLAVLAAAAAEEGKEKKNPFQGTFQSNEEALKAMREREPSAPRAGAEAPDFELERLAGKGKVSLSDFRGKAPVLLLFGSYT